MKSLFKRMFKVDKSYTSDLDQFLARFDRDNPKKSASQLAEITKYDRINELRDNPEARKKEDLL